MSLNLEILELLEDVDPTTRQPRLRVRVRELKPRSHLVNLKNCDAQQIGLIQRNVGGVMSLPCREMLMEGRFMVSLPVSEDEYFVIRSPEKIAVAKTVDLQPVDHKKAG